MNKFVGENLKAQRLLHGLETGDAAGILGVSEATYLAFEESREMPSLDVLKKAGEFYGVVPADFFGKMNDGNIDEKLNEENAVALDAENKKGNNNEDITANASNLVAANQDKTGMAVNQDKTVVAVGQGIAEEMRGQDKTVVAANQDKTGIACGQEKFESVYKPSSPKANKKASLKAFDVAILALSALCALITVGYFFEIGKYSVNISTASDMVISGYEAITSYNYFNLMGLSTPCFVFGILLLAVILWDIIDSILLLSIKDLRRGLYIKISKIIRLVTGIVSTLAMILFLGTAAQKIGAIVNSMEEIEGVRYVLQELDGFGYFSVFIIALLVVKAVAFAKVKPDKSEADVNIIKSPNSGDVVGVDTTIKQTSKQIEEKSIIN